MTSARRSAAVLLPCAALACPPPAHAQESPMTATGTFQVDITPETRDEAPGSTLGRMALSKTFEGDLVGRSRGTMLTATTEVDGSAGYVAVERVTGTLQGREGTFVLQHSGVMHAGEQSLTIRVVPASGTGELEGITGAMSIRIEDGVHYYELEYELPAPPPGGGPEPQPGSSPRG